ncbi:hypothetical protein CDV36_000102 [Fusarium kuroshium]|uniref:NAD-dependent epimerase/dehydratase domain-containing protein n=1 Tax=Fusarium kuroshium TaxID=2010991 RepID=A0A3M2SRN9_9HYPO|nr:hypothetical protein CDV36_000102 [Fusarium kuroshium]
MSSSKFIVPPQGLVLVTGVNGFIGSHIANNLLSLGYRVRGTVRDSDKADWITEAMQERNPSGHFEVVIIPDVTAADAWSEVVQGVDGIVHVATDMSFDADPNKVITPIVQGPGSTGKWVRDFWKDPGHYKDLQQFGASWYIDVEDTALLHIAALTQEDVKSERLLGFAGPFNFNSWLDVFRQLDPSKPWPDDDPSQEHNLCKVDTGREVELLKRFGQSGWTSFYESVRKNCLESRE